MNSFSIAFVILCFVLTLSLIRVWIHGRKMKLERDEIQRKNTFFMIPRGAEGTIEPAIEDQVDAELETYFESSLDLLCIANTDGYFLRLNPEWEKVLGYSIEDLQGKLFLDFVHPDDRQDTFAAVSKLGDQEQVLNFENRYRCKDGSFRWIEWRSKPRGKLIYAAARDITESKAAREQLLESEAALKRQHEMLSALLENLPIGVFMVEAPSGKPLIANKTAQRILGRGIVPGAARDNLAEVYRARKRGADGPYPTAELPVVRAMQGDSAYVDDMIIDRPDGSELLLEVFGTPIRDEQGRIWGGLISFRDITAIKATEAEREKLQAQLAQAQKMESIGRLAGGVAHDFNNMLAVILGRTEIALPRVQANPDLESDLQSIRRAARRSAEVVRQLLAFARKQTIKPRALDLNEVVSGMLSMLCRLIGEDIELVWKPGPGLWSVRTDKTQLEQVLLNLCVNARDAISAKGRIVIETFNQNCDRSYSKTHPDCSPGEFACLQVSDNGCGMDQEILAHLFEPFFTTKETGRGTGLGLASIYGAVRQNKGFINVVSEPGSGTSIRIHLPRDLSGVQEILPEEQVTTLPAGRETILLVEDEAEILDVIRQQLIGLGYTVLFTDNPARALKIAVEHQSEIHLLLSDVVMPEMNGRQLGEKICEIYPAIRLLFMSGYTTDVIAHHGVLDPGVHFIQKPFSINELALKIRDVLKND